jgi:hypothetical protein
MILMAALLLAMVAAWIRGGRLAALADVDLRWGWLALLGLALQLGVIYGPVPTTPDGQSAQALLLMGSYGLLCVFAALNRRSPGMPWLAAGMGLNLLVMAANGGFMPVTPEVLEAAGLGHLVSAPLEGTRVPMSKDIVLAKEATRLWWLGDLFVLRPPARTAFSPGDVALALGALIFFHQSMRPSPANERLMAAETEN